MKPWMRKTVLITSWIVGFAGLGLGVWVAAQPRGSAVVTGHTVRIHQPMDQALLVVADLAPEFRAANAPWTGKASKEINIPLLEEKLRANPFVENAEVFSTWDGRVQTVVKQKQAKARIVSGLQSVYADASGNVFPLSAHDSPRLPLVSGVTTAREVRQALKLLDRAAQHSAFPKGWYALDFDEKTGFTAFPEWHPHRIVWGDAQDFAAKAHRSKALYAYALQNQFIDQLDRVDVRFADQVVFTRTTSPSAP
jgi:cell division protein FtsQ